MSSDDPVIRVDAIRHRYGPSAGLFGRRAAPLAVDGVSFDVRRGSTFAIVGESGSGKSTLAKMMIGLVRPTEGQVLIEGRPVMAYHRRELAGIVQMIFQDPLGSLNPRMKIGTIVEGPLLRDASLGEAERRGRLFELMDMVGLRRDFLDRYPHEFSGGQCQRIGIARALAASPRILLLDEPVSALDVSIQAQVLHLFRDLQQRLDLTYVLITHDLGIVDAMADEIVVMKQGKVVEQGGPEQLLVAPRHDYTRELLKASPFYAAEEVT